MQVFNKIANVFLAMTILMATTGFTLNKHYCMGRLVSVAINESASPCSENGEPVEMPCCEDISEELKVEELATSSFDFDAAPTLVELVAITFVLAEVQLNGSVDKLPYQYYDPPPIEQDIPVLVQSFLI